MKIGQNPELDSFEKLSTHVITAKARIQNRWNTLDYLVISTGQAYVKHGMTLRRFNYKFKGLEK